MNERAPSSHRTDYRKENFEKSFFVDSGIDIDKFYEEVGSEAERNIASGKAKVIFERLKTMPVFRPLVIALGVLFGAEMPHSSSPDQLSESDRQVETIFEELENPLVRNEFKRIFFRDLVEKEQVHKEIEGQLGRDEWGPMERINYEIIPTLPGKFRNLHKDHPEVLQAYDDPRGRVENFETLVNLMSTEFIHSRLAFDFIEQSVNDAVSVLPNIDNDEAYKIYEEYVRSLVSIGGLKPTRELASKLKDVLSTDHPIVVHIEKMQWLSPRIETWFRPSINNLALFNQTVGQIEIYHRDGKKLYLLETFPGNGGPSDAEVWRRGMASHDFVSTPDGEFTFDESFEKKSAPWKSSWVLDTAPLRWTEDNLNVEYKDSDNKWRRLTGEDAEFTFGNSVEKPFRQKHESMFFNAATKREDGQLIFPTPFTIADALDEQGELRSIWDRNAFGPKAIQIKDSKGPISIFFHSSPDDEDPNVPLQESHGCVHVKPKDIERMDGYLTNGSIIRIAHIPRDLSVAQTEKPEVSDESAG